MLLMKLFSCLTHPLCEHNTTISNTVFMLFPLLVVFIIVLLYIFSDHLLERLIHRHIKDLNVACTAARNKKRSSVETLQFIKYSLSLLTLKDI